MQGLDTLGIHVPESGVRGYSGYRMKESGLLDEVKPREGRVRECWCRVSCAVGWLAETNGGDEWWVMASVIRIRCSFERLRLAFDDMVDLRRF